MAFDSVYSLTEVSWEKLLYCNSFWTTKLEVAEIEDKKSLGKSQNLFGSVEKVEKAYGECEWVLDMKYV